MVCHASDLRGPFFESQIPFLCSVFFLLFLVEKFLQKTKMATTAPWDMTILEDAHYKWPSPTAQLTRNTTMNQKVHFLDGWVEFVGHFWVENDKNLGFFEGGKCTLSESVFSGWWLTRWNKNTTISKYMTIRTVGVLGWSRGLDFGGKLKVGAHTIFGQKKNTRLLLYKNFKKIIQKIWGVP